MARCFKFYEEYNFVITIYSNEITNQQLVNGVLESNYDEKRKPGLLELVDCRNVTNTNNLTTDGILTASKLELDNEKYMGGKLAIIADRPHIRGLAMQYSLFAEKSREAVNVVNTVEEAISWLGLNHLSEQIFKDIDELYSE